MPLAERLRQLRLSRDLAQRDVADALQISPARYSQYERGVRTPDFEILKNLARFYGVSVDYLLSGTVEEDHPSGVSASSLELGETIRHLLKERGWSIEELSRRTDLPVQTLKAIELGTLAPDIGALEKIADAFGVTIDYLVGRTKDVVDFLNAYTAIRALGEDGPVEVPILRSLSLPEIIEESREERPDLVLDHEFLPAGFVNRFQRGKLLGYIANDESMLSFGIYPGSKIIFVTGLEVKDGDIIVAQVDDQTLIRKIRLVGEDWVVLIPGHPLFEEEVFPRKRVRVIGKVIRIITDLESPKAMEKGGV